MSLFRFPTSEFWVGREQFGRDLVAGVTVGIVALPLAIGFGITSGMSAQAGIATAILAGFIAELIGRNSSTRRPRSSRRACRS